MAERRMFAKTIVLSDAFLDMPMSARCLYFTLGMFADDDGFINNPKSIMRQCGASQDDMNILLFRKFLISFDDGVIVIKHWRIHNYIQKDRYIPTKYEEHKLSLGLDSNNAYTLDGIIEMVDKEPLSDARQKRLDAVKNSSLPYSFTYKIRQAFVGEKCPICGCTMGVAIRSNDDPIIATTPMPTIQHNIPISQGGTHELDNISVICSKCNMSIQDKPTGELNNALVAKKWAEICGVSGMDTQVSIGKNSIDKNRVSIESNNNTNNKKAVKHKHGEYGRVLLTDKEYEKLVADFGADKIEQQITLLDEYVESNNNKNKYTNFNLVLRKSINNGWFDKTRKPTTEYDVYDEF